MDVTTSRADRVLPALHEVASAIRAELDGLTDWGLAGTIEGQYRHDLVADRVGVEMLVGDGFGVLSEESGLHHPDREVVVALDPVDGSTNASRGLPWYATSLCALDSSGPLAAVVANQASGTRFEATRGGGARRDGEPIRPAAVDDLAEAIVGTSGCPPTPIGSAQLRCLGAAALDLCAVASGSLDGFADFGGRSLAPWDYLGGILVCQEAGATVSEVFGRDPVTVEHGARRTLVAAGTAELCDQLRAERRRHGPAS
ncbi:MAG: inositol monophosphatase [Actinomycetota bacterium]|nr:inositol monophosphatase [Actinomycetota bacterium]